MLLYVFFKSSLITHQRKYKFASALSDAFDGIDAFWLLDQSGMSGLAGTLPGFSVQYINQSYKSTGNI